MGLEELLPLLLMMQSSPQLPLSLSQGFGPGFIPGVTPGLGIPGLQGGLGNITPEGGAGGAGGAGAGGLGGQGFGGGVLPEGNPAPTLPQGLGASEPIDPLLLALLASEGLGINSGSSGAHSRRRHSGGGRLARHRRGGGHRPRTARGTHHSRS